MKLFQILILIFILQGCDSSERKRPIHCENMGIFGEDYICLPELSGYTECYKDILIQINWKKYTSEENQTIGLYLTDKNMEIIRDDRRGMDKFYHVYIVKGTENLSLSKSQTEDIFMKTQQALTSNEMKYDDVEEFWKNKMNLKIEKPLKLKLLEPNEGHFAVVMIQSINSDFGQEQILSALNILRIDGIPVVYTYQANANNYDSIESFEEENNKLGTGLLLANYQITF